MCICWKLLGKEKVAKATGVKKVTKVKKATKATTSKALHVGPLLENLVLRFAGPSFSLNI